MNSRKPRVSAAPGVDLEEYKHKKVNRIIPVHQELRRDVYQRECDQLLQEVKVDTGCIVVAYWDQYKIIKFDIFGGPGVEKAVGMLNKWIERAHKKTKDSAAWAKLSAYDENKWYNGEVEQMEQVRKNIYKTDAAEGEFKVSKDHLFAQCIIAGYSLLAGTCRLARRVARPADNAPRYIRSETRCVRSYSHTR